MKNRLSMGWQGWLGIEPAAAGFGDQLAAIGIHPHMARRVGYDPTVHLPLVYACLANRCIKPALPSSHKRVGSRLTIRLPKR